ncbi:hypothetical protein BDBG_03791 [Blastomyces gilchristii SLH14081]|uniref:Killer toxin Kp4 domain-containing protein n=1 Tax=Blastomyces gilchristii (strain SLH14081) TaxID=559298 RepID=A0A179UI73_BLAGS|nr:uncharacterized protein BDBG_03791 [Blastomyces gilchristii SLH14081]OAT07756.1 hypothetical protein BDBG_03791 [Blastomyces gilchristii SLH14081]
MKITTILSTAALALLSTSTSTTALGTNCRGKDECNTTGCQLSELEATIARMPTYKKFKPGQEIACCTPGTPNGNGNGNGNGRGRLCAYTQHTNSEIPVLQLRHYVRGLYRHGCRRCGSFAFDGRDVFNGELTVDYRG